MNEQTNELVIEELIYCVCVCVCVCVRARARVCVCVRARACAHDQSLSYVRLFAAPGTVACQASLSMDFSTQEYWSGFPFPAPGDLPDSRVEPTSPAAPALAGRFFTTSATWEAPYFL